MTAIQCYLHIITTCLVAVMISCNSQQRSPALPSKLNNKDIIIGGDFEGADFMFLNMPKQINSVDTSDAWFEGDQRIIITGTVYEYGGKIPASNVTVYYYHTNREGKYIHLPNHARSMPLNSKGQTHGYIRGWVTTDKNGRYNIFTTKPGRYPSFDEPAHIHLTIKEPLLELPYYIDDLVFDDDPLLTKTRRQRFENRGGSGVLRFLQKDGQLLAEHDIILGLNIPDYPVLHDSDIQSGRQIGEDQPSFTPYHVYGPDKGRHTCPVCKYGRYHGLLFFVNKNINRMELRAWLTFLEHQSKERGKYLKTYLIFESEDNIKTSEIVNEMINIGDQLCLQQVALTVVPSFDDVKSEAFLNRINPEVKNTIILYKHGTIIDKWINLQTNKTNFNLIITALDQSVNKYFDWPTVSHE